MKNKTKLIAKLVLVAVLGVSILSLFACSLFGDSDWIVHYKAFNTHLEFANFIQKYNSNSDSNTSSFLSFDFDNDNANFDKYYEFRARAPYKSEDLYDKNTTDTNVELIFYYDNGELNSEDNALEYKIKCSYRKPERIFYYTDNFEIKVLTAEEMFGEYLINAQDYQDERLSDNNTKYDYVYSMALFVNGENKMSIKFSSTQELSESQLDGISQLLLDNIVIINTEV